MTCEGSDPASKSRPSTDAEQKIEACSAWPVPDADRPLRLPCYVDREEAYGTSVRLSFQIKVF